MRSFIVVVSLLAVTGTARAYTPIPFAEVAGLEGKQVFLSDSVELDRKTRGWAYAGQAVTLESCAKTTSTITADGAKVTGWKYSRCKVKTAEGTSGSVPFKLLSKTALAFDLSKPGKAAALRKAAFEEAYATALAMVKFAKAHRDQLGSHVITGQVDHAPVLAEYAEHWYAMAGAFEAAKRLHRELVVGSRLTTESILRDRRYGWVADAQDEQLMRTWSGGEPDAAKKKRLEAGITVLGKLNGVAAWGTLRVRVGDERAAKSWRRGTSGTASQQAMLDKEHEAKLDKRLADGEAQLAKQLAAAKAGRRSLSW